MAIHRTGTAIIGAGQAGVPLARALQGAEIVQLFVQLIAADATAQAMLDAVHIHPTLAEAAKNAVRAAVED